LLEKFKKNYRSIFCTVFGVIGFLVSSYFLCSFNHFDPWTGAKLYPSFATLNFTDLYNQIRGPYILTVYGPCASFFYLPATLGNDPESCMWIALSLNILTTVIIAHSVFLFFPQKKSPIFIYGGISFLFFITLDKTTKSLFQIHYDLPTLFYFFLFFLLFRTHRKSNFFLFLCLSFLWLTVWTKITALPWLFLPHILNFFYSKNSTSSSNPKGMKLLLYQVFAGIIIALIFGIFYGFKDIYFHLFEATNGYPWRECTSLFGNKEEIILNHDIISKLQSFVQISLLYIKEYWWIFFPCLGTITHQATISRPCSVLTWLPLSYFLVLPACLSALAKFGGVENSLLFAHFFAYLTIFLQCSVLIEKYIASYKLKQIVTGFTMIVLCIISLRKSATCIRNTSESPQQLAFEYIVRNSENPIFFPMSPLINYLATKEILDSGEALTYSTMMAKNALPSDAGLEFLKKTKFIAFGNPPYSKSYFQEKLNLIKVDSPKGLESWNVFLCEKL
jgi:hypothetical protein